MRKRREIVANLSEFKNESLEIETGDVQDMGDKAESSYTKEFLLSLSDTQRTRLAAIDEALIRIKGDDFGICEDCGKKIAKKRLTVSALDPPLYRVPKQRRARLLKLLELVFFPSRCFICSVLLENSGEKVVCGACLEKLEPRRSSFCVCCGKFFEVPQEPHLCSSCIESRPPYDSTPFLRSLWGSA